MPFQTKEPESRSCPRCGTVFQVGGRGRPKKSQVYCSHSCHMLVIRPAIKGGSHAPRPKKNLDTLHNEEWLRARYLDEALSMDQIAAQLGCSKQSVAWAIKKFDIPARGRSESKRGRPSQTVWTPEMRAGMTEKQRVAWETRDRVSKRRGDNYHPDRKERQRRVVRAHRRGVTGVEYDAMLEKQNGLCLICGRPETALRADGSVKVLSVDHSHTTGKIRGLLCIRCNAALGLVNDDVATLHAMVAYLDDHDGCADYRDATCEDYERLARDSGRS